MNNLYFMKMYIEKMMSATPTTVPIDAVNFVTSVRLLLRKVLIQIIDHLKGTLFLPPPPPG